MPYKDPERKRQWEQEHREQRNAKRKTQRLDVGSRQPSVSRTTSDLAAALRNQVREPAPDPVSDQESQGIWIALFSFVVTVGVVLLAAFVGVSLETGTDGSGNLGKNLGQ